MRKKKKKEKEFLCNVGISCILSHSLAVVFWLMMPQVWISPPLSGTFDVLFFERRAEVEIVIDPSINLKHPVVSNSFSKKNQDRYLREWNLSLITRWWGKAKSSSTYRATEFISKKSRLQQELDFRTSTFQFHVYSTSLPCTLKLGVLALAALQQSHSVRGLDNFFTRLYRTLRCNDLLECRSHSRPYNQLTWKNSWVAFTKADRSTRRFKMAADASDHYLLSYFLSCVT